MNILPILNTAQTEKVRVGARYETIGTILFQSGVNINPDITIGNHYDMIVSAIIRTEGIFDLEIKTHYWEDGVGVFYPYDTVDDIIHLLKKKIPGHLARHFEGKDGQAVRKWAMGVLREVSEIEEGDQ